MPLITATDLDGWSGRRDAQANLPTLVRRLVMATVSPSSVRVPAGEGISSPGFDGVLIVDGGAPPYVPAGGSVWELGTGNSGGGPKSKAENDYAKRTGQTSDEERASTTFVFVTSRTWDGAADWAQAKVASNDGWADVVALDAQDLATWLSIHPGVHGWLEKEHLGREPYGITALRDWFIRWAERTEPAVPAELLLCGRNEASQQLLAGLDGAASEVLLAARGQEEAVAFVAAALIAAPPQPAAGHSSEPTDDNAGEIDSVDGDFGRREAFLERALVVHDGAAWRQWTVHEHPLVLVPLFPDPDVDAAVRHGHHVVLPRAARPGDLVLPPLRRDRAREVWERAGVPFAQADDLARAAGRSLTSLRRRIGRAGRFRQPAWADGPSANLLAALLLAGAWADDVDADRGIVVALADRGTWRSVARDLAPLSIGEDAPVVEREHRWEFVDIVDAWDALSGVLTAEDLDLFHENVLEVLGEEDPTARLGPEERRALAVSTDGLPRRSFSGALRRGMANTLALLGAVAGDRILPGGRTGEEHAAKAVRALLHRPDVARWIALADLLPVLAEAAPGAFLDAVEESLQDADASVMALFAETDDPFGLSRTSRHSALLWALEALAFSPRHLSRAAVVLGRLAEADPGGRLSNRPAESLWSVLHLVRPQGAADATGRMPIVDAVRRVAPRAGWSLMLSLINGTNSGMILRQGPRFREWQRETPAPTYGDVARALSDLTARVAEDASSDGARWVAALGITDRVPAAARELLLDAADAAWPGLNEDIQRKALAGLSERVNRHVRFRDAAWALNDDSLERLQRFLTDHAVEGSGPDDPELFGWWPGETGFDPDTDVGAAELAAARGDAVRRALVDGIDGLTRLAELTELPGAVGETLARVTDEFDDQMLVLVGSGGKVKWMANGWARARRLADAGWMQNELDARPNLAVELLLTADIDDEILGLLNGIDPSVQTEFWQRVEPWRTPDSLAETVAEQLLRHDRPFSAMWALHESARRGAVPVDLTERVMRAPSLGTREKINAIVSPQYVVGQLLEALEQSGLSPDDLAALEWLYLPVLGDSRVPQALHRKLASDPAFFVEVVCTAFRRRPTDDMQDTEAPRDAGLPAVSDDETASRPEEPEDEIPQHAAAAAFSLLREWRSPLPGTVVGQSPTSDQLQRWVTDAKEALAAAGRADVGSVLIGEALSGPAADSDGTWPSEAVRDVLEHEQDRRMEEGLAIGRLNQRGVTTRGLYDGGAQERALEATYRGWATAVRGTWPRAGAVLDGLADNYAADARREDESAARDNDR